MAGYIKATYRAGPVTVVETILQSPVWGKSRTGPEGKAHPGEGGRSQ